MSDLLNPDDALRLILANISPRPSEGVPLANALGRVLAADMAAPRDLPPFANSSLDGFAVRASETNGASRQTPVALPVALELPAGASPGAVLPTGTAARIMTGAPLPAGADAVIPVEATDQHFQGLAEPSAASTVALYSAARLGDGVRPQGEDVREGQRLLAAGNVIRPQDIGMAAAFGYDTMLVIRRPRVVILSTGDELATPGMPLEPGQIYDGNGPMLAALVAEQGGEGFQLPITRDSLADVRARFAEALSLAPDAIISSGGVSVGAYDVVRAVLEELGQVNFWRVNLRPGKPLAFGTLGPHAVPFFGLPGNPVSAYVTYDVFVRPSLNALMGRTQAVPPIEIVMDEALSSDGRRTYVRVVLEAQADGWHARLTGTQSSGALSSLIVADALAIIPEGVQQVQVGARLAARMLRAR